MLRKSISLILVFSLVFSIIHIEFVSAASEDIRFDFETDLQGAYGYGASIIDTTELIDGECVLTTKSIDLTKKQIQLALPKIDFGSGGYYMYVKARYELPEKAKLDSTFCATFSDSEYKNNGVTHAINYKKWDGYEIIKIEVNGDKKMTDAKGERYPKLYFLVGQEGAVGVAKVYIDWIVFSKSETAPREISNVDDGTTYKPMYTSSDSAAVRFLVSLGIMNHDENIGVFWDDTPLRRSQMAEILCKLYGLNAQKSAEPMFKDVMDENRAAIETVVMNGYMSGCGGGIFAPNEYITREQLVTVFVTMLGAKSIAESIGGYPDGYYKMADRLGIRYSKLGSLKGYATRLDVANIIYDAMHSEYLKISGFEGNSAVYDTIKGETFLSEVMGIYRVEGIMVADDVTSITSSNGQGSGRIKIGDRQINDPRKLSSGYLGYDVIAYEKRTDDDMPGELIYIEESKDNNVIKMDGVENIYCGINDDKVTYYKNDKKKTLNLPRAVDMIYNGVATDYNLTLLNSQTNDEIIFIDNNDDKNYDLILIYDYQDYLTNIVRPDKMEISLQYGEKTLRLEDDVVRVYYQGIPSSMDYIGNNEVISVAVSNNSTSDKLYTIKTGFETVSGTVNSIGVEDERRVLEIGDKEYFISDYAEELITKNKLNDISSRDEGTFYLNVNGKIASYILTDRKESVACLVGYRFIDDAFDYKLQVILYTLDGKIEKLTSDDRITINGQRKYVDNWMEDTSFTRKISNKQLVKYTSNGTTIKSLIFAEDGYNPTKFSKDVPYTALKCTRTTILAEKINGEYKGEKYRMSTNTKTFKIPIETSLSDDKYYMDESLYGVVNGPFFSTGGEGRIELYDLHEDGTVDYALLTYVPYANRTTSDHALLVVDGMGKKVNQYDEIVDVIYGYNESGSEAELQMREDGVYVQNLDPDTLERGDIINYYQLPSGEILQVLLRRNADTPNGVKTISASSKATSDIMLNGKVAFKSNDQISIYTSDTRPETPLDVDGIVSNTGSAVYLCDGRDLSPIGFDEIEQDDQITAILNGSNKTRILVVYR